MCVMVVVTHGSSQKSNRSTTELQQQLEEKWPSFSFIALEGEKTPKQSRWVTLE